MCIANIIKINFNFLGNSNYQKYIELWEKCKKYKEDENAGIDENEDWYKDIMEIIKEIKKLQETLQKLEEMKKEIKNKYREKFDRIDSKFTKKKDDQEFIDYILELRPYDEFKKDKEKEKNILEIKKKEGPENLVKYLMDKYDPKSYSYNDEQSKLDYCIVDHIYSYLYRIYTIIQ